MTSTYESKNTWTSWRKANFDFFKGKLEKVPDKKNKKLLDLGAGPEQFRDITWQFECISVDFKQYGTTKIVSDLTRPLPIEEATVDIVFMSNFLEHVPWPLDVLNECHRILKPGGMIIGTVPFLAQIHQQPYDFNRYTNFMLELLLDKAGFERREIVSVGKLVKAYLSMQDQFFSHLCKTKFSGNNILQFSLNRIARLVKFLSRVLLALYYPLALRIPPNTQYTQGYGFMGYKK